MKKILILSSLSVIALIYMYANNPADEASKSYTVKTNVHIKSKVKDKQISKRKIEKKVIPSNIIKESDNRSMDTVASRQKFSDELVKNDSKYIYDAWVKILDTQERRKLNLISDALAWKLQHSDEIKVYEELNELYTYSEFKQQMILTDLLGRVSTAKSTSILLEKLMHSSDNEINSAIYDAIDNSVSNLWDGEFHIELSEPLEKVWNKETKDMKLLSNIGNSIAKIGSQNGIKLLIGKMKNYTLDELKNSKDNQAIVAFNVLENVTNPDAIDVLSDSITNYNDNSAILYAKINALASQRNVVATASLLSWAKNTKSSQLVKMAFSKLSDTKSLELVKKSLKDEVEEYRNYEIREVMLEIVKNK